MWLPQREAVACLVSLLSFVTVGSCDAGSTVPIVDLGYAKFEGVSNSTLGTTTFWGLHYAAAPVSDLRWRAPVPIEKSPKNASDQLVKADRPGVQCVQGTPAWEQKLLGLRPCNREPVACPSSFRYMVEVGYTQGNSQTSDGHSLVQHSEGTIIYVQIQYRLGVYGFLGGDKIQQNGDPNVGLLDQRLAMHWVHDHIDLFGGDPESITIWGGSAGGGAISNQLILYGGKQPPPYRAAIAEYPWWQSYKNQTVLETQYEDLLAASNCSNLDCLRNLSHDELFNATSTAYVLGDEKNLTTYGDFYFGPYVDGEVIRDLPSREYERGAWSKVPLLVGHDAYEGATFTNGSISSSSEVTSSVARLFPTAGEGFLTRLSQLYPLHDFTKAYFASPFFTSSSFNASSMVYGWSTSNPYFWQLQQLFGDFIINCPTYYLGLAAAEATVPVWKMIFSAGTYVHGASTTVTLAADVASANSTLSALMKSYFLAFITNQDPNHDRNNTGAPRTFWPQYVSDSFEGFAVLQVNKTSVERRSDPDASAQCDFWRSASHNVRN